MEVSTFVEKINKKYLFDLFCFSFVPFFLSLGTKLFLTRGTNLNIDDYVLYIIIVACSIKGIVGMNTFIKELKSQKINECHVQVASYEHLNSVTINYLLVHFIPYALIILSPGQVSTQFLLLMVGIFIVYYQWYVRTDLILTIPFLLLGYSLYKVRFNIDTEKKQTRVAMFITKKRTLKQIGINGIKVNPKFYVSFDATEPLKLLN